jgi:ribosomal protein S18 acetylase RimI-like enzyme
VSNFELVPLTADHRRAAEAFAAKIPEGERAFIDRSLLSQVSVAGWTRRSTARRTGAFIDDEMVAIMTVNQQAGWMSQVGELRLVVLPEARGRGLATQLADRAVDVAVDMGLSKLYVEVLAQLDGVIAMFVALGFEREAVLRNHVVDGDGRPGNLCILSKFLTEHRG